MVRKLLAVVAVMIPLAVLTPSSAHSSISILGYQYFYNDGFEIGLAGGVSTEAGHIPTATPTTDVIESVVNRDAFPHTLTECVAPCDGETPDFTDARFDTGYLDPGENAAISVPAGTVYFACQLHPFMRGSFNVTGE